MSEYISLAVNDKNFMIAQRQVGSKDKYRTVGTCRSEYQAKRIVDLLNAKKDAGLLMVAEFADIFKLPRISEIPEDDLQGLANIAKALQAISLSVLRQNATKGSVSLVRVQLMVEELAEVVEAMAINNKANILHELADLRYTIDGTVDCLELSGVFMPALSMIHEANMSKLDEEGKPIFNASGRVVKSKLFKKADVSVLL